MLLITRRTGEAIVINGSIEVKVLDVKGGRVKLGFEYPEGSTVYRQELFAKIQQENKAAALGGAGAVAGQGVDSAQLSNMVRNLLPETGRRGEAPAGDEQKGRNHDNRALSNRRPSDGDSH